MLISIMVYVNWEGTIDVLKACNGMPPKHINTSAEQRGTFAVLSETMETFSGGFNWGMCVHGNWPQVCSFLFIIVIFALRVVENYQWNKNATRSDVNLWVWKEDCWQIFFLFKVSSPEALAVVFM